MKSRRGSIVLVQRIVTAWTKASRGGEGARRRNALPDALPVPLERLRPALPAILRQEVLRPERSDFEPSERLTSMPDLEPLFLEAVTIEPGPDRLTATYRYVQECGVPQRWSYPRALDVGMNEWAQIVYNGRFSGGYRRVVVNVGLFDNPGERAFLERRPTRRYADLARLY